VTGGRIRFSPDELPIEGGRVTASEVAASMAVARDLDVLSEAQMPWPSAGFTSRVMTAVAAEPGPQPVTAFARALAGGRFGAMLRALRDAWQVSTSPGRPTPVRAQALALVMLVLLAFGSLAGVAGAAVGLFDQRPPSPSLPTRPAIVVPPSPSTRPADQVEPAPPAPSSSPEPSASPTPSATPGPAVRPTQRPIATPRRTATPQPTESDDRGSDAPDLDESPSPAVDSPSPSDKSGPG
jgi:hypothetical protein